MELQVLAIATSVLTLALAYVYRFITSKFNYFQKQGIDGPKPSFPFGTWKGAWKKNFGENDLNNVKTYGQTFGSFDGRTPNLIVSDPHLIQKILVDKADKFHSNRAFRVKQKTLHEVMRSIEGGGDVEVNKLLSQALNAAKVKKLFTRIVKTVDLFVEGFKKEAAPEKVINVNEHVSRFITDVLAFTLFSFDLAADNQIRTKFERAIGKMFTVQYPDSIFSVTPFVFESLGSLDNFILKPAYTRYLAGVAELVIDEKKKTSDVKPEGRALDLVDLLLVAAEEEKQAAAKEKGVDSDKLDSEGILSKEQMINVCMQVLLTVGGATKQTLAMSIYALANNTNVQDKLQAEVGKQLNRYGEINYEFINESEYLDMFLGEILRIYPTEYRLERKTFEEMKLDEITLTPGTMVSIPIYAVHHLEEFYPEPEKFIPERFSPSNFDKRNPHTYLPFGQAGSNSSNIGVQLGVLIAKLAIVSLIKSVKLATAENPQNEVSSPFVSGVTGVPQPKTIFVRADKKEE
ncbi:cytochrome P450 3A11 [Nilaparvata lugens]|uniref:cytochrome P450 3A11 n=1 Tax=Nilaparvata lugens TaxID=108931 RepID=UPI00193DFFA7|nr:cytochrome P450 3A11 [Nilaparvata lugens]